MKKVAQKRKKTIGRDGRRDRSTKEEKGLDEFGLTEQEANRRIDSLPAHRNGIHGKRRPIDLVCGPFCETWIVGNEIDPRVRDRNTKDLLIRADDGRGVFNEALRGRVEIDGSHNAFELLLNAKL